MVIILSILLLTNGAVAKANANITAFTQVIIMDVFNEDGKITSLDEISYATATSDSTIEIISREKKFKKGVALVNPI